MGPDTATVRTLIRALQQFPMEATVIGKFADIELVITNIQYDEEKKEVTLVEE